MDRSLVEMERSRSGTASSRGIGTTVTKETTPPHNGTVVDLLYWRNIQTNAGGHRSREPNESRADYLGWSARRAPCLTDRRPAGTGLHAANDAGRRRDSEPAAMAAVRQQRDQQTPDKECNDVSNAVTNEEMPEEQSTTAQPMAMRAAKKVAKKAAPKKAAKKAAPKKAAKKAAPKKAAKKVAKKAAPKKAAVKKAAVKKAAPKKAVVRRPRKSAMPPMDTAPMPDTTS